MNTEKSVGFEITKIFKLSTIKLALRLWMHDQKSDIVNVFIIVMVWIAMVVLANPVGEFPLNDDWVYALAVKSLVETGYFQFPAQADANVGSQVYWGYLFCLPFGFSFTALRISTLTLGLFGIFSLYASIKELGGQCMIALLGALVLAVNPLYFGLANSFMTDVPFLSLIIITLYFFVRWFQRNTRIELILGLFFSFAALLVRQFGILVLVGFAFAYLIRNGIRLVNIAKAFTPLVIGILLHLTYKYWLKETVHTPLLSNDLLIMSLAPIPLIEWVWATLFVTLIVSMYMGFFVIPFVPAFFPRKLSLCMSDQPISIRILIICIVAAFLFILWWGGGTMPTSRNILIQSGLGPLTLRDTYLLGVNQPEIPALIAFFWMSVSLFAKVTACAVIFYVLVATHQTIVKLLNPKTRPRTWPYFLFVVMGTAYLTILVIWMVHFRLFDRYLIPLLTFFILLVSSSKLYPQPTLRRRRVFLSVGLLILYAAFSVAATHDYLSWNRTRWLALHSLIDDGKVNPSHIDGGFEFNGWTMYDPKYASNSNKRNWWRLEDYEYIITSGPLVGYIEVRRYPFTRWLLFSESNIFVLRKNSIID